MTRDEQIAMVLSFNGCEHLGDVANTQVSALKKMGVRAAYCDDCECVVVEGDPDHTLEPRQSYTMMGECYALD